MKQFTSEGERRTLVKMFTFHNSSLQSFPLETLLPPADLGPDLDWLREFEEVALREARSKYFLPHHHRSSRVKRSHCQGSRLGIFNFLLFLVVLLGLLSTLLNNAMLNIMINGQSVSLFQVKHK